MPIPFLTEPVALWEYLSLHTQTQECRKYNYYSSSSQRRSLTVTFLYCQLKWGPVSYDSYGWLRGERRACHKKVTTRPAGFSGSGLATQRGIHNNG